jgi:hypothetical protein
VPGNFMVVEIIIRSMQHFRTLGRLLKFPTKSPLTAELSCLCLIVAGQCELVLALRTLEAGSVEDLPAHIQPLQDEGRLPALLAGVRLPPHHGVLHLQLGDMSKQ